MTGLRFSFVVSSDSDLAEPIRVVRQELGLEVAVLDPHRGPRVSNALKSVASSYKTVRPDTLHNSQFPARFEDAHGTITKPPEW